MFATIRTISCIEMFATIRAISYIEMFATICTMSERHVRYNTINKLCEPYHVLSST